MEKTTATLPHHPTGRGMDDNVSLESICFICIRAKTRESPNAGTELRERGHRVAEVQVGWKQDTVFQLRLNLPPKLSPPEKTHGRQPPQKLGLYSWLGSKVVELRSCTITNLVLTSAKPHKDNIIQNCIYR